MRTETITRTVYSFDELSEEAKETAINNYRGDGIDTSHNWVEASKSVKAFHNVFGSREGYSSWLDINTENIEDAISELSGQRLRTYLLNNFGEAFYERKYLKSGAVEVAPAKHRMRKIEVAANGAIWVKYLSNFLVESSCPFTGVCWDENLLDPFKAFIKNPDSRTFEDLLGEAVESLQNCLEKEGEYRNSDEAITEWLSDGDDEYTEDGEQA